MIIRLLRKLDARTERWFPYALTLVAGILIGHGHARAGVHRAIRQALGLAPPGPRERLPELRELAADVVDLGAKAATDSLTGLPNRLGLDRYVAQIGAASPGLAMIDLDHFKRINDQYGHPVGDLVLRDAASRLRDALAYGGVVGRWGGEEFLVLAPGVAGVDLFQLGEVLRAAVRSQPIVAGNQEINVTCSIGVATPDLQHESLAEAIDRADQALLMAKESRDAVVVAD